MSVTSSAVNMRRRDRFDNAEDITFRCVPSSSRHGKGFAQFATLSHFSSKEANDGNERGRRTRRRRRRQAIDRTGLRLLCDGSGGGRGGGGRGRTHAGEVFGGHPYSLRRRKMLLTRRLSPLSQRACCLNQGAHRILGPKR